MERTGGPKLAAPDGPARPFRRLILVRHDRLAMLAALLALTVVFSIASPYFLSIGNALNILLSVSVIGTLAAVTTLVLVARMLDLSIGSIAALSGVVVASLADSQPLLIAVGLAVLAGAACGIVNGVAVLRLRIDPLIVTIGTLSIFRGLTYVFTGGDTVTFESEPLMQLGSGRILGVPWSVLIVISMFLACHAVATTTIAGRTLYAIGANPRASMLSGINLARCRFWVFLVSGAAAGLAGVLLTGQSAAAAPNAAIGYELLAITAVLLGGTSLRGGEGSVLGTLVGVLILGVLNNGMTLLGVGSYYQTIANGALLLAAVALDQAKRVTTERE